jgi:hypothetical protein
MLCGENNPGSVWNRRCTPRIVVSMAGLGKVCVVVDLAKAMQMELIASYQTVVLNVHAEVENAGMPHNRGTDAACLRSRKPPGRAEQHNYLPDFSSRRLFAAASRSSTWACNWLAIV